MDLINGWNGAGEPEVDRAEAAAKKAISLDYNTPLAHHALGWVNRLRGKHQAAFDAFNEAVKIDPNFARAYAQVANEMVFLGNAKSAFPLIEKAIQLSPNDPSMGGFLWVKGRAYFTLGDYPNAIKALKNRSVCGRTFGMPKRGCGRLCPTNRDTQAKRSKHLRKLHNRSDLDQSPNTTRKSNTRIQRCRRLRRNC